MQRPRRCASCDERRVSIRGEGAPGRALLPSLAALLTQSTPQAGFVYAKTEGLSDAELLPFTYLLSARSSVPGFALQEAVHGFSRLRLRRPPVPLAVDTTPQIYVHARAA